MSYDVLIVGGGPSGLSSAIKLKQLAKEKNIELSVCILEKGSSIGSHILSGACIESKSLSELFPNWKELGAPLNTEVTEDRVKFLTETNSFSLPVPPSNKFQYLTFSNEKSWKLYYFIRRFIYLVIQTSRRIGC